MKDLINKQLFNSRQYANKEIKKLQDELAHKEKISSKFIEKSDLIENVLEKLHLKVSSTYISGRSMALMCSPINDKFRFIKDRGFDSNGNGRNQATLTNKANRISEKIKEATNLRASVNEFSLEESKHNDVLIDLYIVE